MRMEDLLGVNIHPSALMDGWRDRFLDAISKGFVPPIFLYQGPRSASLWERLHVQYASASQDRTAEALYRRLFEWLETVLGSGSVELVSLGCGLAEKEGQWFEVSGERRIEVQLLDGSFELVAEAKRRRVHPGFHGEVGATVADLTSPSLWRDLARYRAGCPVIYTLFGMLPTLAPEFLIPRIGPLLRERDWLLLDANLIPDSPEYDGTVPPRIVSQYDNPETREWLLASLAELGIYSNAGSLAFHAQGSLHRSEVPRIVASFAFNQTVTVGLFGKSIGFSKERSLRVFRSNRYSVPLLTMMLEQQGIRVVHVLTSETGEDGLLVCRSSPTASLPGGG